NRESPYSSAPLSIEVGEQLPDELDLLPDAGKVGGSGSVVGVAFEVADRLPELLHLHVEHPPLAEMLGRVGAEGDVHVDPAQGAGELAAAGVDPPEVGEHP